MEFEPPVLFVVRGAYGRPRIFGEVSALKPIRELFSQRSGGKFGPKMAGDRSLSKGEKAKEDRQFESPPLHQRGTANRRSRSLNSRFVGEVTGRPGATFVIIS
jgi:hypothetical protein